MKITLKALRVLYGLSQKEAAELVGINERTWFNYENCKTKPPLDTIQKILATFNVKYEDLSFKNHLELPNKQQEN